MSGPHFSVDQNNAYMEKFQSYFPDTKSQFHDDMVQNWIVNCMQTFVD